MTQDELASEMGITGQTIARYEKCETEIPGPADLVVRIFFAMSLMPEKKRGKILESIRAAVKSDETKAHRAY